MPPLVGERSRHKKCLHDMGNPTGIHKTSKTHNAKTLGIKIRNDLSQMICINKMGYLPHTARSDVGRGVLGGAGIFE